MLKKYRTAVLAVLLLISLSTTAQNGSFGLVTYEVQYTPKNVIPDIYTAELIFSKTKAVFVYDKGTVVKTEKKDSMTGANSRVIMMRKGRRSDEIGKIVFTDFDSKKQVSRYLIKDKPFIITDTIVPVNWTIGNERKNIASIECQSATCIYYGRDYKVWFALNIPAPYGPWKLMGLPGLILEASSSDNEVKFVATSVRLTNENNKIDEPVDGEKIAGYRAFRALQDQKLEESRKRAEAIFNEQNKTANGKLVLKKVSTARFEKTVD